MSFEGLGFVPRRLKLRVCHLTLIFRVKDSPPCLPASISGYGLPPSISVQGLGPRSDLSSFRSPLVGCRVCHPKPNISFQGFGFATLFATQHLGVFRFATPLDPVKGFTCPCWLWCLTPQHLLLGIHHLLLGFWGLRHKGPRASCRSDFRASEATSFKAKLPCWLHGPLGRRTQACCPSSVCNSALRFSFITCRS